MKPEQFPLASRKALESIPLTMSSYHPYMQGAKLPLKDAP
jgi:hypothetical protein